MAMIEIVRHQTSEPRQQDKQLHNEKNESEKHWTTDAISTPKNHDFLLHWKVSVTLVILRK